MTRQPRDELRARLASEPFVVGDRDRRAQRGKGVKLVVSWLADQEGATWQQRWLASGADAAEARWREVPTAWLVACGDSSAWRRDAWSARCR